jgi:hypothetical protein
MLTIRKILISNAYEIIAMNIYKNEQKKGDFWSLAIMIIKQKKREKKACTNKENSAYEK